MRVDGSIKTVTAGVTSLDDKRHNGTFSKIVDNWRCDPMQGLVKRPAQEILAVLFEDYRPTWALFPIYIRNERFWVLIVPAGSAKGIGVFNDLGENQPVENAGGSSYFDTIEGTDDIAYIIIDDVAHIANKKQTVVRSDLLDTRNRSSMIVVKQAPAPFSKITIQWTDSTGFVHQIENTRGDETEDHGTNTVAEELAALMKAALDTTPDNIYVQGSTILYQREDEDFAEITGTDGARDAVIATINADTSSIENLGKYAGADCVVNIRPDPTSDRGSFYMRANPVIETETGTQWENGPSNYPIVAEPAMVLVCGSGDIPGLPPPIGQGGTAIYIRGFISNDIGSMTPPTWNGNLIGYMYQTLDRDQSKEDVEFFFGVQGTFSQEDLEFMYLLDTATGKVHSQTKMLWLGVHDDGAGPYTEWSGNGGDLWENGQTFNVFDEYSDAIYGKVPEVRWEETADPEVRNRLQPTTMPHILGRREDGVFVWGPSGTNLGLPRVQEIRPRQAGSDETNPMPTFVDHTINDLGRFQDRLCILSSDTVTLSVTDKPYAWFRETATQQLATDPIGMKSSSPEAKDLLYIVSHNNDALIFSRDAQYKLVGSVGRTSQNAALPQTTSYDSHLSAKPISNGSDVFFPIQYSQNFAGLSKFSVDRESDDQDTAINITDHVQKYLVGEIKQIVASSTLNMVFVRMDTLPHVLYVLEYVESRQEPQIAWSRWVFLEGSEIISMDMEGTLLQGVMKSPNSTHVSLFNININALITPNVPRNLFLDYLTTETGINTSITLFPGYPIDHPDLVIVEGIGAPNPDEIITGWTVDGNIITLPYSLNGGGVALGVPYKSIYMPSRRWVRDDSGTPQTASKLRITDYGFHALGDEINVDVLNGPETWPTQTFTNNDPSNDKYHRISFKQRHDEADIEIWTDDIHNTEISQIEWRGTYFKTGRRF